MKEEGNMQDKDAAELRLLKFPVSLFFLKKPAASISAKANIELQRRQVGVKNNKAPK